MKTVLFFIIYFILASFPSTASSFTIPDPLPSCKGFKIYNSLSSPIGLGFGVSGGGDINDDNIPDIIVTDNNYPSTSTIYIIYGTKTGYSSSFDVGTMTSSQGFRITGVLVQWADNANFISSEGDVDGDGIADLVIGASGTTSGAGVVYVVYGKKGGYADFDVSTLTSSKGFKITGNGGRFGANVDTRSDFNGDGIADIIIGARLASGNSGTVNVIYGQTARESDMTISTMAATRGFTITGASNGFYGTATGSVGDFNGDDIDDMIFAGPGDISNVGKAYVIYGQEADYTSGAAASIDVTKDFIFQGAGSLVKIGTATSPAGDFNNDKIADFMIASTASYTSAGSVFVIYGGKGDPSNIITSSITPDRGFEIQGEAANIYFGSSLASIADLNGDGITEIMIGAPSYSTNYGAVYVIYGRDDQPSTIDLSTLTSEEGVRISPSISGYSLGNSMRNLGDVNP